jgi:hypothetical protein
MAKKAAKKKPVKPRTDGCYKVPRISRRDFEIYELCKGQGLRQKEVAAKFKITQPRISTIVNRVAQYLGTNCPAGYFELPRETRLVSLFRTHRMRLDHTFEEAMDAWKKSKEGQHRCKYKPVKGTKDFELVERISTNKHGDQRHLQSAVKFADRLMEFEGFDRRGQVDTTIDNRIYEAPDVTEIEAMRLIKERAYRGEYDTPGDQGPPDWFLKKVGAKQPGNGYKPYVPEVIFPTTSVIKATNNVITPSASVTNNDQTVINNGNITAEKPCDTSQAVTQPLVANSATAEKVLSPSAAPKLVLVAPTPVNLPSKPRAENPNEVPVCTREEAKRRKLMMWREPEKDPKALPYMTLSDWK